MRPTRVHAPGGGHFVEHQHRAGAVGQLANGFQEAGLGLVVAHGFHHDRGQIRPVGATQAFQLVRRL